MYWHILQLTTNKRFLVCKSRFRLVIRCTNLLILSVLQEERNFLVNGVYALDRFCLLRLLSVWKVRRSFVIACTKGLKASIRYNTTSTAKFQVNISLGWHYYGIRRGSWGEISLGFCLYSITLSGKDLILDVKVTLRIHHHVTKLGEFSILFLRWWLSIHLRWT